MKLINYILLILVFSIINSSFASSYEDSLLLVLKNEKVDTSRVKLYNDLSKYLNRNYPKKSLSYSDTALYLALKINYKKGLAIAYINKGIAYRYLDEYDKALSYNYKALEVSEEMNNYNLIAGIYINNGIIFWKIEDYSKAKENYLYAKNSFEKLNDYYGLANVYLNLGIIYALEKDYISSEESLNQALHYFDLINDHFGIAKVYNNISALQLEQINIKNAIKYNKLAFNKYEELNDLHGMILTLIVRNDILYKEGNYQTALNVLSEAEKLNESVVSNDLLADILLKKSLNHEKLGNHQLALNEFKMYKSLQDSIQNQESKNKILELESVFQNEKKQKEIELLNKEKVLNDLKLNEQNAIIEKESTKKRALIIVLVLVLIVTLGAIYSFITKKRDNLIIRKQKQEVETQHHKLEEAHKEITDSINYAEKIQTAILNTQEEWEGISEQFFILFKPKDIVSGDFYWAYNDWETKRSIWVVADCTGHGVPGAFMSMLGISFLNEIIIEKGRIETSYVLDTLRKKIVKSLEQKNSEDQRRDGMDMSVCIWDKNVNVLSFSGANNPIWIISSRESLNVDSKVFQLEDNNHLYLHEIKPTKQPAGYYTGEFKPFLQEDIKLLNGDIVYSFTDGFADQFGGESTDKGGKKFKYSSFKKLLLSISHLPMDEQKVEIEKSFYQWKGSLEQVDDICIIAVRLH